MTTIAHRTFNSFEALSAFIDVLYDDKSWVRDARSSIVLVKTDLEICLALFERHIQDLGDISVALQDLDVHSWISIEDQIRIRCGALWGKYLDSLKDILDNLAKIACLLSPSSDPSVVDMESYQARQEASNVGNDYSRQVHLKLAVVSMTGLGGELAAYLSEITYLNKMLSDIVERKDEPPTKARLRELSKIRAHNRAMANILGAENGFGCDCGKGQIGRHRAYLRIQRGIPHAEEHLFAHRDALCSLVFHNPSQKQLNYSDIEDEKLPHWNWREVGTRLLGDDPAPSLPRRSDQYAEDDKRSLRGLAERQIMRVRLPYRISPFMDFLTGKDDRSRIHTYGKELCVFLENWQNSDAIGETVLLRSGDNNCAQLEISRTDDKIVSTWCNVVEMATIWDGLIRPTVTPRVKLELAFKLACAIFYASSTPWTNTSPGKRSISFVTSYDRQNIGEVLLSSNLLSAAYTQRKMVPMAADNKLASTSPEVMNLARYLVEISLGSGWEQIAPSFLTMEEFDSQTHRSSNRDREVISRILEWASCKDISSQDNPFYPFGSSYVHAIKGCLELDIEYSSHSTIDLDDEEFAGQVYSRVYRPLEVSQQEFERRQCRVFGPRQAHDSTVTFGLNSQRHKLKGLLCDGSELQGDADAKKVLASQWRTRYKRVLRYSKWIRCSGQVDPKDRIRVAILDTGADVTHADLGDAFRRGQIIYKNFFPAESDSKVPHDEDGHGTHVASLLLSVAPDVDIYVARAIDWAVRENEVHVISISFGFPRLDHSLEDIRRALLEAHAKDVLIFACSGNEAENGHLYFPASMDEVISIGSTTGDDKKSDFGPILRPGNRLCVIGEGLEAAWIRPLQTGAVSGKRVQEPNTSSERPPKPHRTMRHLAGTSYATPIAAGIAAMLLDCVQAHKRDMSRVLRIIRTKQGMLAALKLMRSPHHTDDVERIVPEHLFKDWGDRSDRTTTCTYAQCAILHRLNDVLELVRTGQ